MNKVDKFINSIFENLELESNKLNDLKFDMKNNLIESIQELKKEGYTEEDSINIAIKRFGDKTLIQNEIINEFKITKFDIKSLILTLIFCIVVYGIAINLHKIYFITPITLPCISIPIYITYELIYLYKCYKYNTYINKKYEILKVIFNIYLFILIGSIFLPIYTNINFSRSTFPILILNPFKAKFCLSMVVTMLYFIPLGLLVPILFNKFKKFKNCIMLIFCIFILKCLIIFVTSFLGIGIVNIISLDRLIIYFVGTLIGYLLYIFTLKIS